MFTSLDTLLTLGNDISYDNQCVSPLVVALRISSVPLDISIVNPIFTLVWNIFVCGSSQGTISHLVFQLLANCVSPVSVKIKNKNKPGNTTTVHSHGQL